MLSVFVNNELVVIDPLLRFTVLMLVPLNTGTLILPVLRVVTCNEVAMNTDVFICCDEILENTPEFVKRNPELIKFAAILLSATC